MRFVISPAPPPPPAPRRPTPIKRVLGKAPCQPPTKPCRLNTYRPVNFWIVASLGVIQGPVPDVGRCASKALACQTYRSLVSPGVPVRFLSEAAVP